jgi:hypothetical protein
MSSLGVALHRRVPGAGRKVRQYFPCVIFCWDFAFL